MVRKEKESEMKKTIILIALLVPALGFSQNFSDVLYQIEKNNKTLQALRSETDAAAAAAHTGIALADPEVELGYLWGTPKEQGNRVDINVTQTFDFPSVYIYRKRIADGTAGVLEHEYLESRRQILLEAETACIESVYRNALACVLYGCLANALGIYDAWSKKEAAGDASSLEVRKASLNLLTARKAFDENEIEREALSAQLSRLNGGVEVSVGGTEFMPASLPEDFEQWFSGIESPAVSAAAATAEVAQSEVKLQTAGWLPKFSVGYVSERIAGTTLQGVGLGLSIPLWENHGRVRAARASAEAAEVRLADSRLQFHDTLKTLWAKGQKLQKLVTDYNSALESTHSLDLLHKALDAGEISLLDYLVEQDIWIDALQESLSSQRDLQDIAAELRSYE